MEFRLRPGRLVNEAFSEYFSSIAVQKIVSEEEFKSVLENYRKHVEGLPADAPSLSGVPFMNDWNSFVVRYYKGALMLNQLKEILGEEKFFQNCRDFFQTYKEKSIGTDEFRNFWQDKLADRKELLNFWLDAKGGWPKLEEKK